MNQDGGQGELLEDWKVSFQELMLKEYKRINKRQYFEHVDTENTFCNVVS